VVDQTVQERTIDLDNVVTAASKIVNEIVFPRMKETMVDLKAEFQNQFNAEKEKLVQKLEGEKEESRKAIREELRSEFQVQFDEKEQELIAKLEAEKEILLGDFEQEMRTEKAAMRLELQQNVDEKQAALEQKVDEKQDAMKQSLQDQVNKMNEKVIFAAVRSSSGNMDKGTITYDSLTTNIGNGMDSSTGKFTTPTSGLYMFTFSAVSANTNTADVTIVVKKNNIQLFVIDDEEGTSSGAKERNIAYSWMLNLSTGDIVHLEMSTGGLHADASNAVADQVHFTGHLLHAN